MIPSLKIGTENAKWIGGKMPDPFAEYPSDRNLLDPSQFPDEQVHAYWEGCARSYLESLRPVLAPNPAVDPAGDAWHQVNVLRKNGALPVVKETAPKTYDMKAPIADDENPWTAVERQRTAQMQARPLV